MDAYHPGWSHLPSQVSETVQDFPYHWGDGGKQPKICSFLPPGKKISLPTWTLSSPIPPNTKFLFLQASNPRPLTWYRHIEKEHWDWSITMDRLFWGLATPGINICGFFWDCFSKYIKMEAVYVSYLWEVWTAQSKKNFLGDFT